MALTKKQIDEAKEIILEGIGLSKSLAKIKKKNPQLPSRQTIYNWLNENHDNFDAVFLDNYIRAREDSADLNAEEVNDIANKTLKGDYDPQAARVAIDAKKWSAGVKEPKKYGKRLDLTTKGDKIKEEIDYTKLSTQALKEIANATKPQSS